MGQIVLCLGQGQPKRTIFGHLKVKKNKAKSFFLQNPEISLDYLNVKDVKIHLLFINK